ncbi:MAG: hypothetical protein IT371_31490 [Deltaproteobacteria bacterium]|nr:hypothetical protein [Deltaproteobacteria bacterium]
MAEALAAIGAVWQGGRALLGSGTWVVEGMTRLGLLQLEGNKRPHLLWHGYVGDEDVAPLRAALEQRGRVLPGGLDFMFQTPWKVAWTEGTEVIELFDRGGLRCVATHKDLSLHPRVGAARRIPVGSVRAVQAEGYAYRSASRVRLVLDDNRLVGVLSAIDLLAPWADDPWGIYEGWTTRAAAALATRIGVPVVTLS